MTELPPDVGHELPPTSTGTESEIEMMAQDTTAQRRTTETRTKEDRRYGTRISEIVGDAALSAAAFGQAAPEVVRRSPSVARRRRAYLRSLQQQ